MIIIYRMRDGWHLWDTTTGADVRNHQGAMVYETDAASVALCQVSDVPWRIDAGFVPTP